MAIRAFPFLFLPVLLSCGLTDVEEAPTFGFEGAFEPDLPDHPVSGTAAAVTQLGNTEIGIAVTGLEAAGEHPWRMRDGSCAGDGTAVADPGVFVPLLTDSDGGGERTILIGGELNPDAEYAVELFGGPEGENLRLACADLARSL